MWPKVLSSDVSAFQTQFPSLFRQHAPILLKVIDLKATVRRRPARLHRREICTQHLAVWILICHVYTPYSRASTQVQYLFRIMQRTEMKLPVQLQLLIMMFYIHAIQLLLIVREMILASIVAMISAAMLELVPRHGGYETRGAVGEGGSAATSVLPHHRQAHRCRNKPVATKRAVVLQIVVVGLHILSRNPLCTTVSDSTLCGVTWPAS